MSASAIESMTGYGEARAKIGGRTLVCRVKSLNHRFLDLKVRLPRGDMATLDQKVRKQLSESFKRGAIELTLVTEHAAKGAEPVASIDLETAEAYIVSASELAKKLKKKKGVTVPAPLTMDGLMRLPGVISNAPEEEIVDLDENELFAKAVQPAIAALKKARREEGAKLSRHLDGLIDEMNLHLGEIKKLEEPEKDRLRTQVAERARETLKILNTEAGAGNAAPTEDFAARLREEASFWVERRDFEEERVRFEMHLKNFRELLGSKTEVSGRKLEFVQQELLRETNTLGTKAQSPSITGRTIELKAILERLKEQLANVE